MITFESRHTRRFVGRIERGEDVLASLKRFAMGERIRAAWVRMTGIVEWVEVTEWDSQKEVLRAPRRIEGPLTLLAGEGNISFRLGEPFVEMRAALSRETDMGVQTVGGQLVVVSALSVEFMIEVFEDVRLDRDEERETGLSVWKGEKTPGVVARATKNLAPALTREPSRGMPMVQTTMPSPRAMPQASDTLDEESPPVLDEAPAEGVSWSMVAAASERAEKPSSAGSVIAARPIGGVARPAPSDDSPKRGDFVEHRQFGLCRVEGVDPEGALIIRLTSGIRKTIHMDPFELVPPRFEGDRRIIALRPRKR